MKIVNCKTRNIYKNITQYKWKQLNESKLAEAIQLKTTMHGNHIVQLLLTIKEFVLFCTALLVNSDIIT